MIQPIEMLQKEMEDRLADKNESIDRLHIFKLAIWKMASKRLNNVDDYIMIAKQAIADYEALGGTYKDD